MNDRNCRTCIWHHSENKTWCNNCQLNNFIPQWPHADNFDFWQENKEFARSAIETTEQAQAEGGSNANTNSKPHNQ